jgi:hypothetical protein
MVGLNSEVDLTVYTVRRWLSFAAPIGVGGLGAAPLPQEPSHCLLSRIVSDTLLDFS